ncbi:DUF294 nucleotidyltransferase-like domain-containing protein [Pasteurellaceae bacterium 22721_9_1]
MIDTSLIPNIELFIAQVPPLNYLPPEAIAQIASQIEIRYIPKGELIVSHTEQNPHLYIIRIGEVDQIDEKGDLRAKLEEGAIFGFSIFNRDDRYSAFALENTLIYQIAYPNLDAILKQYPEFVDYFSNNVSKRLSHVTKHHLSQGQNNVLMKTVAEVANAKVVRVESHTSIQATAQAMSKERRSSALVMQGNNLIGIVNDRDMTKKAIAQGMDISLPITEIMIENPPTIQSSDLVLNAVSIMMANNVRSLPVLLNGKVHSILTAIDLLKYTSLQSIFIVNQIFQAENIAQLLLLSQQRQDIFQSLVQSGAAYNNVMKVMTLIADAFSQKLLSLAEETFGPAPCAYSWNVLGSQARYEMHLFSDQDSSIITERELSDTEKDYFLQLAQFVVNGLAQCGYELCSGDYMANNPLWCQSLQQWKAYFDEWILNPEQQGLLNASVFMDIRTIHGDPVFAEKLQQHIATLTQSNKRFLAFMVANSVRVKPPISIFRNFVLSKDGEHKNQLNLKKRAINLLVDLGRIYAFAAGVSETLSTEQRFNRCYQLEIMNKETLDNALEAYQFVCDLRFKYQALALAEQQPASNYIAPDKLTLLERNHLKDAFRLIYKFQEAAEMRFSQKGIMR